jgi:hypothetical protein
VAVDGGAGDPPRPAHHGHAVTAIRLGLWGRTLAAAHRGEGFVKRREDSGFSDRGGDAVPVHVGPQVAADAREHQIDASALQLLEQVENRARGRVVEIRDRGGIDDEPVHWCRSMLHEGLHFIGEAVLVGVEEIRTEPIDDQSRLRLRARRRRSRLPPASGVRHQDHRVRPIAVAHVPEQRQRHCQEDAFLDADEHDHRGRDERKRELPRALAADVAQASDVDEPDGDRENDATEHAKRQVLKRAGQEQQHEHDRAGEHDLRDLGARPGALGHRVWVGLPFTTNAPLTAAAAFAAASPRISASSSMR